MLSSAVLREAWVGGAVGSESASGQEQAWRFNSPWIRLSPPGMTQPMKHAQQ